MFIILKDKQKGQHPKLYSIQCQYLSKNLRFKSKLTSGKKSSTNNIKDSNCYLHDVLHKSIRKQILSFTELNI